MYALWNFSRERKSFLISAGRDAWGCGVWLRFACRVQSGQGVFLRSRAVPVLTRATQPELKTSINPRRVREYFPACRRFRLPTNSPPPPAS